MNQDKVRRPPKIEKVERKCARLECKNTFWCRPAHDKKFCSSKCSTKQHSAERQAGKRTHFGRF